MSVRHQDAASRRIGDSRLRRVFPVPLGGGGRGPGVPHRLDPCRVDAVRRRRGRGRRGPRRVPLANDQYDYENDDEYRKRQQPDDHAEDDVWMQQAGC